VASIARISNGVPTMVISSLDATALFGARGPTHLVLDVKPGVTVAAVRQAIQARLGSRYSFNLSSPDEIESDVRSQIDAGVAGFVGLLGLAAALGLFGLANTMAVSVVRRHREIGVLRAIGARRSQVRGMAVVEAMTLVAVAYVLAVPLGLGLSRPFMTAVAQGVGDFTLNWSVPWLLIPVIAVIGLAVGGVASAWPAQRAARLDIDATLRLE
jgi:putative ABC transport system permease protein